MNSQSNPTSPANGLSLPPVDPGQAPAPQPAPQPTTAPLQAPAPQMPTNPAPSTAVPTPAPAAEAHDAPAIADDADLIEKEWVEKAKQLVDQTKNDPYKQNKEINKFKAVYIKKRYNKDIQLDKD